MSETLARIIRSKMADSTLPSHEPTTMRVGVASASLCTACDNPVLPPQPEYEIQYDARRVTIRLHVGCYLLWKAERNGRPERGDNAAVTESA